MARLFHKTKLAVNPCVSFSAKDRAGSRCYIRTMALGIRHDWFLRQWLDALQTTQAMLERETGWDKRKTSHLINGKQPYKRDTVNEAAAALHIQPFELLMHPDDAFALRRLRDTALSIAAETRSPFRPAEAEPRTGRRTA
jgi:hypothetical protein